MAFLKSSHSYRYVCMYVCMYVCTYICTYVATCCMAQILMVEILANKGWENFDE